MFHYYISIYKYLFIFYLITFYNNMNLILVFLITKAMIKYQIYLFIIFIFKNYY